MSNRYNDPLTAGLSYESGPTPDTVTKYCFARCITGYEGGFYPINGASDSDGDVVGVFLDERRGVGEPPSRVCTFPGSIVPIQLDTTEGPVGPGDRLGISASSADGKAAVVSSGGVAICTETAPQGGVVRCVLLHSAGGGASGGSTSQKSGQILASSLNSLPADWFSEPLLSARPFWIPSDVTEIYITIANRLDTDGTALDDATIDVAYGTPNVGLTDWATTPTVVSGVDINCAGTKLGPYPVTRNAAGYVMVAWYAPTGVTLAIEACPYGVTMQTGNTDLTNLSGATPGGSAAFHVLTEWETSAPRLVILGDSLMRGLLAGGSGPGLNATLAALGPQYGISVTSAAVGGMTLLDFGAGTVETSKTVPFCQLWDSSNMVGAVVLIALGVNDFGLASVTDLQRRLLPIVERVKSMGASKIWLATIPPATGSAATSRPLYNQWIKNSPFGDAADYIFDINDVVADPAHPNSLLPAYDSGDGLHWNAAAYTALVSRLVADGVVSSGRLG